MSNELAGKIAVVTGPTSGIGKEIARGLARLGAEVVLASRTLERGEAARQELAQSTGNTKLVVMQLDVGSLASVRAFATALEQRYPKVHLLVNNAGVWLTERHDSPEGHELTFATNVLGPFLLTNLLRKSLVAAAPARVVNVVSTATSSYDATDLDFTRRKFDGFKVYGQSKAAMRLMSVGLARRFEGTGVTVAAAAPGFVKTDFSRSAKGFTASMIKFMSKLFAVDAVKGAETPLWVATDAALEKVTAAFYDKHSEQPEKFNEPKAVEDLYMRLEQMTSSGSPPPSGEGGRRPGEGERQTSP